MEQSTGYQPQKTAWRGLPVKRSINLAGAGQKKTNWAVALPVILVILLAAAAMAKFGVIDRLAEVNAAQNRVSSIQTKLDEGYQEIDSYGELKEKYAHYTYSGMTPAELSRADRMQVLDLLDRVVLAQADLQGWDLTENVLTLYVTDKTLQEVNLLAQRLEEEDLVEYCMVSSAQTNQQDLQGDVSVQVSVKLKDAEEVYW